MPKIHCTIGMLIALSVGSCTQQLCACAAEIDLEALSGQVTIRRDTYGIPHILARTEEAAAFALGYAQAEDHCVAIGRLYVSARGEEARHFGTGADNDFLMALYDNRAQSARDLIRLDPFFRRVIESYVAGLNRYITQHREELPPWLPIFAGADVLAYRRAGAIRQVFSQETVRSLQKKYSAPQAPFAVPSVASAPGPVESCDSISNDEGAGSNALALAGSRTASGHPILLGNPHLTWSSLYWEAQVSVPGKINFFGSTLAGIPVLRAGFNERLGWVTTNNAPDLTDIYSLRLAAGKPDHYVFDGISRPLQKREISLEVRASNGQIQIEKRIFWESHLGKVLYRDASHAFAVRSTLIDAYRYYEGFYRLIQAQNLKQFRARLESNLIPTSNFTYADIDGNIFYQWNAKIPKRNDDGMDYSLDVPAASKKYVWKRNHKVSELPCLLNPSGGYIQNCNNPPWFTSLQNPIEAKKYPSYLEQGRELALRPQMALELIEGQKRFSFEDVKRLKFTTRMLLADRVKPDLIRALKNVGAPTPDLAEGLSIMESWDNSVSIGSRGGVLFQQFWDAYSKSSPQPFTKAWDPKNPAQTPSGLSDSTAAVRHFEEAVRWTRTTYGSPDIAWGEVHRFRFGDLDLPGDGASGIYGLFRVLRFAPASDGRLVAGRTNPEESPVGFGDAWVLLVEFSRPIRACSVLAYGQSSRATSKHSRDQIRLFSNQEFKQAWFTEPEIKANLEREYRP